MRIKLKFTILFLAIAIIPMFFVGWLNINNAEQIILKYALTMSEMQAQELLTELSDLKSLSIVISTITLLLVGLTSFFIADNISKPVQDLTKASTELKKGNLDYKIKIHSEDEIGELAKTFDDMRISLKKSSAQDIQDRDDLLNSLLKTFEGKMGNVAKILARKNVDELVKKNPRIEKILPKSLKKSKEKAQKK